MRRRLVKAKRQFRQKCGYRGEDQGRLWELELEFTPGKPVQLKVLSDEIGDKEWTECAAELLGRVQVRNLDCELTIEHTYRF